MLTYIAAFIFYTLAMIGVLLLGFVIYKKAIMPSKQGNKGMIKILDKINVSPKKSLMVVRVKNEKFLIALDAEQTTFLSKLADEKSSKEEKNAQVQSKQTYADDIRQRKLDKLQEQMGMLYEKSSQEDIMSQNQPNTIIQPRKAYVDDIQQKRLDKIQKQFKQLYSNNQEEVKSEQPDRKEMIRKLLKELNDATGAVKTGSY